MYNNVCIYFISSQIITLIHKKDQLSQYLHFSFTLTIYVPYMYNTYVKVWREYSTGMYIHMWYNIYFSQVEFLQKLFIEKINIYETYHAGGVMRIQAKHPNGSWYTVWQTQNVSDIHSSRIFSPHFDVCIIHVRYIDCEGKREM
jgi:hypothetical protein